MMKGLAAQAMGTDDSFARWASLFVDACEENRLSEDNSARQRQPVYTGVTKAASDLLQSVDAGGIPAFISNNMLEIAKENGIDIPENCTPNDLVAMLKSKAD